MADEFNPLDTQKIEPKGGWNASEPKRGRPTDFSEQLAANICERLADGESLKAMCAEEDMPARSTVFRWLSMPEHKSFLDMYTRAREEQAEALFDEILAISDDGTNDWMEKKDSEGGIIGWQENGEALKRSHMRIEARKWAAAKLMPRKYSDKLQIDANHSGSIKHAVTDMTDDELARIAAASGK